MTRSVLIAGEKCKFDLEWFTRSKCRILVFEIVDLPDSVNLSCITIENSLLYKHTIMGGILLNPLVVFNDIRYHESRARFFDLEGKSVKSCVLMVERDDVDVYRQINMSIDLLDQPDINSSLYRPPNIRILPNYIQLDKLPVTNYSRIYVFNRGDVQVVGDEDEFQQINESKLIDMDTVVTDMNKTIIDVIGINDVCRNCLLIYDRGRLV